MASSPGVSEFSVVDINDEQPKKGYCTIILCDGSIKKKTSKASVQQTSRSVHVTIRVGDDKTLEYKVKKLPGDIVDGSADVKLADGKATLKMKKKEQKSWAAYASDNLECDD